MRILFIGGTGIISSAAAVRAQSLGHEVTLLNRGSSSIRPVPSGVEVVTGDVRDPASVRNAIGDRMFDVVVDFVAFTPEQVQGDIDLFSGRTGQYVFISSASAYAKPVPSLPIRESSPLRNPFWQYSRDKIACEDLLMKAYRDTGFPITIIRPSHTYDRTGLPVTGGWTVIDRMRRGLDVIVPGDGTSLWTLTHTDDFAKAFVGLLGLPSAVGETFQITSDEAMPWNEIYTTLARAAGVDDPSLVHVASETIALAEPEWGPGILGDKAHSVVFDNSKVKAFVPDYVATIPWVAGAAEILRWFDEDESRRVVDARTNEVFDRLVRAARLD
ncbi:nucleoside-diphosphate-sugar epimerase [Frondihabitans sp. PhB188]|uniref:SDR family oxidoreductase n=1 Tax=Frondihabitans sp. PhB188 TaxID=2485200 RepID=UPI000F47DB0C|nr:SDR family oxidoreductase [Frondihabitans sp. PhB188]ROQ37316.1 nucleoside-diphosphate-sugar epimerase [Frondihabitans sp. PhB188]